MEVHFLIVARILRSLCGGIGKFEGDSDKNISEGGTREQSADEPINIVPILYLSPREVTAHYPIFF